MGAVGERRGNFRSEGFHAKIIAPDLTVLGILQNLSLKRGLVVDSYADSHVIRILAVINVVTWKLTKGINDAIRFLLQTRDTTNPFPTVSKSPESLNLVWAIERCWEEVPCAPRGLENSMTWLSRKDVQTV